jgi:hypothetical protein
MFSEGGLDIRRAVSGSEDLRIYKLPKRLQRECSECLANFIKGGNCNPVVELCTYPENPSCAVVLVCTLDPKSELNQSITCIAGQILAEFSGQIAESNN